MEKIMEIFLSSIIKFLENCGFELWFKLSYRYSPPPCFHRSSERIDTRGESIVTLPLTTDRKLQNEG